MLRVNTASVSGSLNGGTGAEDGACGHEILRAVGLVGGGMFARLLGDLGTGAQGMEEEDEEVAWQITARLRYDLLARKWPRFLSKPLVLLVLFSNYGEKI